MITSIPASAPSELAADERRAGRRTIIVHLPADRVLSDARLIDGIIDAVFDALAHTRVEVRISDRRLGATR
jgi:hypothetical protein